MTTKEKAVKIHRAHAKGYEVANTSVLGSVWDLVHVLDQACAHTSCMSTTPCAHCSSGK